MCQIFDRPAELHFISLKALSNVSNFWPTDQPTDQPTDTVRYRSDLPSLKNHASKILILWEMHSKNIWYPYYLPLLSPMFSFFDFLFKVDKPGLMAWLVRWLGFVIFKDIGPPPPNPLKSVQNSKLHYHYHKKVRIGGRPISGSHTSACATILACVTLGCAPVYCNFHKGG